MSWKYDLHGFKKYNGIRSFKDEKMERKKTPKSITLSRELDVLSTKLPFKPRLNERSTKFSFPKQ